MFFDELDAIGLRRTELRGSAGRNVIAQLLSELDGLSGTNDDVFVLGATNQPWDVDPALRRPGRFDRTLLVLPPDREARQAIIERNLRDIPSVVSTSMPSPGRPTDSAVPICGCCARAPPSWPSKRA